MKDIKRANMERSPGADPSVTMLLRAAYAPPAADDYWEKLEGRILARITGNAEPQVAWWSVFSEWRTAGMVAATLALLLTGATIMREVAMEAQAGALAANAAYINADNLPDGVPVTITVRPKRGDEQLPERYLNPFEP